MNIRNFGRVNLNEAQRQQVRASADVLERLAGSDGLWNHADVDRNVGQLKSSGNLLVGLTDFFSPSTIPAPSVPTLMTPGVTNRTKPVHTR